MNEKRFTFTITILYIFKTSIPLFVLDMTLISLHHSIFLDTYSMSYFDSGQCYKYGFHQRLPGATELFLSVPKFCQLTAKTERSD